MNYQRGFTLIELLVVISIIGVLASIVLASLNTARVKARDARRIADLHEIGLALSLYYQDHGGYPQDGYWQYSNGGGGCGWIPGLSPTYISCVPQDPINSGGTPWNPGGYTYAYGSGCNFSDYDLVAQLEDHNNSNTCQNKDYIFHYCSNPNTHWCTQDGYSPYLYADH